MCPSPRTTPPWSFERPLAFRPVFDLTRLLTGCKATSECIGKWCEGCQNGMGRGGGGGRRWPGQGCKLVCDEGLGVMEASWHARCFNGVVHRCGLPELRSWRERGFSRDPIGPDGSHRSCCMGEHRILRLRQAGMRAWCLEGLVQRSIPNRFQVVSFREDSGRGKTDGL